MSACVEAPGYTRRSGAGLPWRHGSAFVLIAVLHLAALAALLHARRQSAPKPVPRTMMVSFIAAAPAPVEAPAPKPPAPTRPKAKLAPKMVATPRPSPTPMSTPPITPPVAAPQLQMPPAPAPAASTPVTTPPDFVAAYLDNPGPKYPAASIRLREEGVVMLLVQVSADGRAEQVTVDRSSGHARLDEAAVEVVRKRWRFVPAKQGDKAVPAWVRIPMSFALHQH